MSRRSFDICSPLAFPPTEVWQRVCTMEGVNAELSPWFRMTVPAQMRDKTLADVPVGELLGRSWLLLFGVLPVEVDEITIASVEPLAFVESSTMLMQRVWRHERRIQATADGCTVTDLVSWEPRFRGAGLLLSWLVPALFRHRHRRLQKRFGATGSRC